jgi:hypothetical protein
VFWYEFTEVSEDAVLSSATHQATPWSIAEDICYHSHHCEKPSFTLVLGKVRSCETDECLSGLGRYIPNNVFCIWIFPWLDSPCGPEPPDCQCFKITLTGHTTVGRNLWTRICPSQSTLPDNTQHSKETDTHIHGGNRTHNPSKRTALYSLLRPCNHRDRLCSWLFRVFSTYVPQHVVLSLRVVLCRYECKQISLVKCGVLRVGGVSGFV